MASPMEEVTRCEGCEHENTCPPGEGCVAALLEQIEHVRVLREDLESRTQDLHEKQVAFNEEHAVLIEEKCKLTNVCSQAEAKLREMTLEAYRATGNKKPAPGVGIRIVKQLSYDDAEALAWAMESGAESCLSLQKTNFKKVAEGLKLDFVKIGEVVQATIAKEL